MVAVAGWAIMAHDLSTSIDEHRIVCVQYPPQPQANQEGDEQK